MATQQGSTSVLQLSYIPHYICQSELGHVMELRRQREALDERIKEAEGAIRTALEAGADLQEGIFSAYLKTTERRSVAWKNVVERELGEDYARRVLAATKPHVYNTRDLGVAVETARNAPSGCAPSGRQFQLSLRPPMSTARD